MRKKTWLLLVSLAIVALFSAYLAFSSLVSPPRPSATEVDLGFYDYSSREAIRGLCVNLNTSTKWQDVFTIAGVSDQNGRIVQVLPTNDIMLPVSAENISVSGSWVLEETVGEETFSAADQKWSAVNPSSFLSNSSEYMFDVVHLSGERDGSTLSLRLDFYLASGRVIAIYNPIHDYYLHEEFFNSNFVEFAEVNYAMIPIGERLTADLEIDFFRSRLMIHISVDVADESFIDLTPSFFRAVSSAQIEELTRSLDNLKPYGFELEDQYNKISEVLALYDFAIMELENQDYESFEIHFWSAYNSYRDLYGEIAGIYENGLWWIPGLLTVLLFFSLSISRLISIKKMYWILLFVFLFSTVFCLFLSTNPYLIIFVSNPLVLFQRFTMPTVLLIASQVLPMLVFAISMFLPRAKGFVLETFDVSIRNLRRRRIKTALALFTVLVVSASAMSSLTITPEKQPISQVPYRGVSPAVESGLAIYKTRIQKVKGATIISPVPIEQYEIRWFSTHDWLEAMNPYGIRKVDFARADGFTIRNFTMFNLIVVNASFMQRYQKVSEVLGIDWFEEEDRNSVIVGSRIAEAYDLREGFEVLIDETKFKVKSIVNEETVVEKLRDIDGDLFLFMAYDPKTEKVDGESFIFGSLDDFGDTGVVTYRVSIILKSEHSQNATQIARDIQDLGYNYGTTDGFSYVVTYSVHAISSDSVFIVYSGSSRVTISGQWQTQIVPIIITTMVLVANAMGAVAERKSEVRTLSTLGASPLRIGLVFIAEGLVLGVVGGVFGYVLGYLLVQYADIALPTLVQRNIIGGTPFTIAVTTATLASLAGCLLPARNAIRIAVPSGRLGQRTKDILKIQAGKAHLEIPVRVERNERRLFERFLNEFADEYSSLKYHFMHVSRPRVEETEDGTIYKMPAYYTITETANFLISISAKPKENLRVTIQPIEDIETMEVCRWTRGHKKNIRNLSPILRENLLRFSELKRKITDNRMRFC